VDKPGLFTHSGHTFEGQNEVGEVELVQDDVGNDLLDLVVFVGMAGDVLGATVIRMVLRNFLLLHRSHSIISPSIYYPS
jgi:hypothetical protein